MAMTIETVTPVLDLLAEATRIVDESVRSAAEQAAHSAAVCGCRGCKAQAVQAAEWATHMAQVTDQAD
jgi:hypothetical protein